MYYRLYHLCMPREDSLSSRFDYLFEPLDAEERTEHADTAVAAPADVERSGSATPMRLAFAGFVLAALAAVAVVAMLLLQQPDAVPLEVPAGSSPTPTTVADVGPPGAGEAPQAPITADDQTPRTVESVPAQRIAPDTPPPVRTSAPRAPQRGASNAPTTRAPISVAPESRAPFPNQGPRTGDNGGGLLGGLL